MGKCISPWLQEDRGLGISSHGACTAVQEWTKPGGKAVVQAPRGPKHSLQGNIQIMTPQGTQEALDLPHSHKQAELNLWVPPARVSDLFEHIYKKIILSIHL